MALHLSEADVKALLPMERGLECVEASFIAQHKGRGINRSRERIFLPHASLHYMAAALLDENWVGMKIYTITSKAWRFVVLLFAGDSGELLAMIEADHLGRIRTGAASGIATKYLARANAARVGLIGAGRQARTQLEAVARVRKLTAVRVFSRDEKRRRDFCREIAQRLNLEVEPAESAEAATRFGDVIITATTAGEPVIRGEWLQPGTHLNVIGANMTHRREVDDAALSRSSVLAVDSLEQAKEEAGDLVAGLGNLRRGWDGVVELATIVAGAQRGRTSDAEITLFKSCGIALWDVAVAGYVYRQARAKGIGSELELWRSMMG